MIELASARGYVVLPVAFIFGSIRPYLNTVSMSDVAVLALALVDSAVVKHYFFHVLETRLVDE